MNILLLSMPDSFEHMPSIVIRMPNGALTSLAGNVDDHHTVAVADLILCQRSVRKTVTQLLEQHDPQLVGLSTMTFQRRTAERIIHLIRELKPNAKIVVGGYDPSLASEAYFSMPIDFIVRGEGEIAFRELTRALEKNGDMHFIAGLSHRHQGKWIHNPQRAPLSLESEEIRLPNRSARVLDGYTMLGRQVDVIETSRGCTFDCSFCSIIEMRGRNFHTYSFDRVIADIRDAKEHGARTLFIVDDNITLNVHRFEALCNAIIDAGLNTIDYFLQGMTSAMANHGEKLAPLMKRAGFRYVFLGIENILESDLNLLQATAKNTARTNGQKTGNATLQAIENLHRNGIYVVGGLIVGSPGDTVESIETNLAFARKYVDWPYIQHPTPYPRTPMTDDFRKLGLIEHERFEEYDGTTSIVKNEYLSADEIEYLRWKAERGMKTRHLPTVFRHDPWFVARNVLAMAANTYRGSKLRTVLGLEDDHQAFARYKQLRRQEREYV